MSKFDSCFISAPVGTNLESVREILRNKNIRWYDQSIISIGDSVQNSIKDNIQSADFFCLIIPKLDDYSRYFNIFYELGIAESSQKPVLIFISPQVKMPPFIQNYTYVRADLSNIESLNYNIDTFIKYSKPKKISSQLNGKKTYKIDYSWVDAGLKEVEEGGIKNFEYFVLNLFKKSGLIVSKDSKYFEKRFEIDLAIWIDSLDKILCNPILVELKYGTFSNKKLENLENNLRNYLNQREGIGLLIYFDKNKKKFPSEFNRWPLIIRLSLSELTELVIKDKFEKEIVKRRNYAIHGGY